MRKAIFIPACFILLIVLASSASFGENKWVYVGLEEERTLALAINPQTPLQLFAGTEDGGVFKAYGGGDYWVPVNNGLTSKHVYALAINPQTPQTLYAGTRGGGVFKSTNSGASWTALFPYDIESLAINPQTPETLYAGTLDYGVFKSTDGGANWTAVNNGITHPTGSIYAHVLAINPQTPETLYVGTWDGVFKTTNGGISWTKIKTGFPDALAINPQTPETLYVGGGSGVFKSTNGGASWTEMNNGLTNPDVMSLAIDPHTPEILYAGTYGSGVFKSTNGGASWTEMSTGLTGITNAIHVFALAIDPQMPETLYAGTNYGGGVFKSEPRWFVTGLTSTIVNDLVINPQTPETLYASTDANWDTGSYGVFKSTDAGASWTAMNNGLPETHLIPLAINPQTPETLYVGAKGFGLFKSTNGGTSWSVTALTEPYVSALAINPQTPETLYAGTRGGGMFKSTNSGASWTAMNNGLTELDVISLAINPHTPEILYAGTNGGGVFKSTNGGMSWTDTGLPGRYITAFAIHPQTPETLYASASTWNGGVFKSTNGGTSWTDTNVGVWATSLAIDPLTPETLYAVISSLGVYKSTNGGMSWYEMNNGLTELDVISLAINPQTPDILYAGTENGVFKLGPISTYIVSTITVTTPNGGENWAAGTTQTISWSYTGNPGSTVKIQLFKGGVFNSTISNSCSIGTAGSGSYSWPIPSTQAGGGDYLVKVRSTTDAACTDASNANFTITGAAPPSITVTSPNGGENWAAGTTQTISWSYTGSPGSTVKIELLKGGVLYLTLSSSRSIGTAGSGSYSWPIRSTLAGGSDYQVKVTSTSNSAYTDTSNANFTITGPPPPSITVVTPNGGENWAAGSTQTISWTYVGSPGSYVKIELFKGGVLNRTIISSRSIGSGGSGSYPWVIPSTQAGGSDYQVKVTSTSNSAYTDTSNANFTITGPPPPSITVATPNGGENWAAGTTQTISWTYVGSPGSYVKIELFKGGVLNRTIISSRSIGSGGSGSYPWVIPSTQAGGSDYQVKVTSTSYSACTDTSNANFTITGPPPPSITVTSPNAGENWAAGTTQTISWSYTGSPGSTVKIELLKGGVLNRTIISSRSIGSGGNGSYPWVIPSTQAGGSDYQVKVTSTSNSAYTDTSNPYFTITGPPPPSITVTSPNGGENWAAGTTQTISWTYAGSPGSYVKIELFKGGVLNRTIISSRSIGSGGSGSYPWVIPSTQTAGSDYQVKVTSTTNSAYTDTSNPYFTITGPPPPSITVTSPNGGENWAAGTTQTISWTYAGSPGSYVKIELFKGGVLNRTIISSVSIGSGGNGSYNWPILSTQAGGSDYQVRVTSTTNSAYTDASDGNFTITGPTPPSITVTSPNGGENWAAGSTQTISWSYTGSPGSSVKIELLKGGRLYLTLFSPPSIGTAGSGSYSWPIRSTLAGGSDYQVRVTSTTNSAYTDTSDGFFTITP